MQKFKAQNWLIAVGTLSGKRSRVKPRFFEAVKNSTSYSNTISEPSCGSTHPLGRAVEEGISKKPSDYSSLQHHLRLQQQGYLS
jgi:hypothetical protein